MNPIIDWKKRRASFLNHSTDIPNLEEGDRRLWVNLEARATSLESRGTLEGSPLNLNQVPQHLHKFADIFLKEGFDELPSHREWNHTIELVPGVME